MKALKITETNVAAIEAALAEINGRCTAHTYTSAAEIAEIARLGEVTLAEWLPKDALPGAVITATSGDWVPNAYRGVRIGTRVVLQRRSRGWYLISVHATTLYREGGRTRFTLTREQHALAVARFSSQYSVQEEC